MPVELEVEGATQAAGTYSKLRPGPGKEASDVAAHQRTRLHAAMIELATERSYESISMRDLMAVAKVSSRTFYKEFSDKQACFESAHEMVSRRLVKRILAAQAGERDPAQCLQRIGTTCVGTRGVHHSGPTGAGRQHGHDVLGEMLPDLLRVPGQDVLGVGGSGEQGLGVEDGPEGGLELGLRLGVFGPELGQGRQSTEGILSRHGGRERDA
jgi:hypothetical protein